MRENIREKKQRGKVQKKGKNKFKINKLFYMLFHFTFLFFYINIK